MITQLDVAGQNSDGSFGARRGIDTPAYLNLRLSNASNEEIRYPTYAMSNWADKDTLGIGRTLLITIGYEF